MDKKKVAAVIVAIASVILIAVCVLGIFTGGEGASSLLQTTQTVDGAAGSSAAGQGAASAPAAATSISAGDDAASSVTTADGGQGAAQQPSLHDPASQQGGAQSQTVTVAVTVDASAVDGGSSTAHVTLDKGASVMDALAASGFSYNSGGTQFGVYISSIGGLAEKQYGATSGWTYAVNENYPSTSCSNYMLDDGDAVTWVYKLQA